MAHLRLYWRRYRRLFICRLLAFSLTATLLCLLVLSTKAKSHPLPAHDKHSAGSLASREGRTSDERRHGVKRWAPASTLEEPLVPVSHRAKADTDKQSTTKGRIDVLSILREMDQIMLDDMRTRTLLDPLVATGEALLRDLAHRVRAFKSNFATWEALHLVSEGNLRRRHDVLRELQSRELTQADQNSAIHTYDSFRFFINSLANRLFPWTTKYLGDHMSFHSSLYSGGRGIVLTAGDGQAAYLLTSIPSFRKLGCDLPIEILYLGEDDLGEDNRDRLEALDNVTTRDLTKMVDDEGWALKGWAAKPFAILMSSFREAVFVDADALFFSNPELLFEDPQYHETGALFFKDRNVSPESKKKWLREILPSPISAQVKQNRLWTGESGHMQDSGVVVIDKWRHFVPLLLATRLNGPDRDGDEALGRRGVYDMVYGDKETFWLSWELAGELDYAFHDGAVGSIGVLDPPSKPTQMEYPAEYYGPRNDMKGDDDGGGSKRTVCSAQLLHFGRDSRPLWFNGWIEKHKHDEGEFEAAPFDVYVKEPKPKGRGTWSSPWDIKEDNVVCLEADESFSFTREEEDVIAMIRALAKENAEWS